MRLKIDKRPNGHKWDDGSGDDWRIVYLKHIAEYFPKDSDKDEKNKESLQLFSQVLKAYKKRNYKAFWVAQNAYMTHMRNNFKEEAMILLPFPMSNSKFWLVKFQGDKRTMNKEEKMKLSK